MILVIILCYLFHLNRERLFLLQLISKKTPCCVNTWERFLMLECVFLTIEMIIWICCAQHIPKQGLRLSCQFSTLQKYPNIFSNLFSLVISPRRHANIARFISGINNSLSVSEIENKINVKCRRFSVRGEARVLMISCKYIETGSKLIYDYNGLDNQYPTDFFR